MIGLLPQPAFLDLLASFDFLTTFRAIDHINHKFGGGMLLYEEIPLMKDDSAHDYT